MITAVEFRLYPVDELYAGTLFFGWERAAEVLQAGAYTHPVPR